MRDALKLSVPVERAGALSEGWTPRDRWGKGGGKGGLCYRAGQVLWMTARSRVSLQTPEHIIFPKDTNKNRGEEFHTHGQKVLLGGNLSGPEAKTKGEAFHSEQECCILL